MDPRLEPDVDVVLSCGRVVPCHSFLLRQGSSVLRHALDAADPGVARASVPLPLRISAEALELALDRLSPDWLRRFPNHFSVSASAAPPSFASPSRSPPPSAVPRQDYAFFNPFLPLCQEYVAALEYLNFAGLKQVALSLNVTTDWSAASLDTSPGNLNAGLCLMSRLASLLSTTQAARLFCGFERELLTEGGGLAGAQETHLALILGPPFGGRSHCSIGLRVWKLYAAQYTDAEGELTESLQREAKQFLDAIVASSVCKSQRLHNWLKQAEPQRVL